MVGEKQHALLSASGAKRWLACPRSVALEEQFPESTSVFAEEGTQAHAAAEILLKSALDLIDGHEAEIEYSMIHPDTEMQHHVDNYIEYCLDILKQEQLASRDTTAVVEQRLDFSEWAPDGFGTGDFMIMNSKRIHVIDLKYGKGVPVSAIDNPQARLYGLGGLAEYGFIYDTVEEIHMHIYQPRLNSVSVEVLTKDELLEWGDSIRARALAAHNNEGDYQPGEHCKFCRARAVCRARARNNLDVIADIINRRRTK